MIGSKVSGKWMKGKHASRIFACFLAFTLFTTQVAAGSSAIPPQGVETQNASIQKAFEEQIAKGGLEKGFDKTTLKEHQKKLGTELLQLSDMEGKTTKEQKDRIKSSLRQQKSFLTAKEAKSSGLNYSGGDLVYVYIDLIEGASPAIIGRYANKVKNSDDELGITAAWVQVDKLQLIAALPEVASVQTVLPPRAMAGGAMTEGDALLKADQFRSLNGLDGSGIKIGIISDGVDHLATAVASGDLPSNVHVLGNAVGGDEGTAMLEIVHDLAPGSELYFHDCGDNFLAFNQAIDDLANAGCQIICDDIAWLTQPYFEDGIIAKHISDLLATRSIVYFSSAGNSAENHYQALYKDYYSGGVHLHDTSSASGLQQILLEIPPGGYSLIVMQWNDRFGYSANDYDAGLYIYDESTGSFALGAQSQYTQDGRSDPVEILYYENNTSEYQYALMEVRKYSGVAKTLEIFEFGNGEFIEYSSAADSVFGHAAAANVIAVGAVNARTPGSIAYYSSQGPATITYPSAVKRSKPDICAIDGVDVTGAGGFSDPFYGTSAAAPHAAAVAALIWSQDPGRTSSQIRGMMLGGTRDMGAAGFDYVYGNGLTDALAAASPAKPSGLQATFDQLRGHLQWNANAEPDLAGYLLQYKTSASSIWSEAAVAKTESSHILSNMPAGVQYDFRLKAKDAASYWSSYSDILTVLASDTTAPPIPSGFGVISVNEGRAVLGWTAVNAADLAGYRVKYWRTDGVDFIETDLSAATELSLSGLDNDEEYGFQITSEDTYGNRSPYSDPVYGTPTDTTAPAVPAGLAAVLENDCAVNVSWTANHEPDLDGYEISYQKYGSASWESFIAGSSATSVEIALDSGTKYNFRIRAFDLKSNWSAYSAIVTLTTPVVTMAAALDSGCIEGSEDGKSITVSLMNGKFPEEGSFDPATIQISGLPAGVTKGETTRVNDHAVEILLSGNSTADYDAAITASVTVAAGGILPVQAAALSKTVAFAASLESAPGAPAVTFSFIGDDGGRLMGIRAGTMEYSLDGGLAYAAATEDDHMLTVGELASVSASKDIRIRLKATLRVPAGAVRIIDIQAPATMPTIAFSFTGTYAGKLVGSTTAMEYSLDGGATYSPVTVNAMKLSAAELEEIDAVNDIRCRLRQTAVKPASTPKVLNILAGPAAPSLTGNDTLNTVSGLTTLMEYKVNGASSWTKYTGTNAPYLGGDAMLLTRVAARSMTAAGAAASLSYSENPPLTAEVSLAAPIIEGAEGGKVISATLMNGEFTATVLSSEITLSGLPAGVVKGTVARVSSTKINIALTGNSTVDYDEDKTITITIKKSQIRPEQTEDTILTVALIAGDEAVPAAPSGIGFSYDGVNAGRLTGVTTMMEYSINGGRSYSAAAIANPLLTAGQIAAVNDADDIRGRVKRTLREPAGDAALLDVLIGSELPETVAYDDFMNLMSGMEPGMEFSVNGGVWTKYTGGNLPALNGTLQLWVRRSASGLTEAGHTALFNFTATNPEVSITASDNGITEGAESGKIITVDLANGLFITTLASAQIQLAGLPSGVSKGTVSRKSATRLTITLNGNSTSDYGSDKTITVIVGKSQVLPAQPADLTTSMPLTGNDAAPPEAPAGVSFSFSGTAAGKLLGSTTAMEYSVDGGTGYYPVTAANALIPAALLSAINDTDDILIRYKKTNNRPAGADLELEISEGQALPETVVSDDAANNITGIAAGMEFSTNGGAGWTKYTGGNLPALSGTLTLTVRLSAFDTTAAGPPSRFEFTAADPALYIAATHNGITEGAESGKIITVTLANGTLKSTLLSSEIQLIGLPAGVRKGTVARKSATVLTITLSGNRTSDYGSDQTVVVSVGKSQVLPLQADNLTTTLAIPGIDAEVPAAPAGVAFSFTGASAGKLAGSTTAMEYSVDGGASYNAVTVAGGLVAAAQLSAINAEDDLKVRYKKTASRPAGDDLTLDILEGPEAPGTIIADDKCNSIEGMAAGMEFSTNGGAGWTKYNGSNLPALNGTLDLLVRLSGVEMIEPGQIAAYTFLATNPELSLAASHNGITEGAESGKIITVTLTNGTLKSTLASSEIRLTGLPAGVSKGTVARKSGTVLTITLTGRSTSDYGSDKAIIVSIGKNQVLPIQPEDLTTEMAMPGYDAPAPAAPSGVAFSFDGTYAGKLIGSTTAMEYSVGGGDVYYAVTALNGAILASQRALIDTDNDIRVRYRKSASAPAGEDLIIDIVPGPALSGTVAGNDETNSMKGMTAQMEFSTDGGAVWTKYTGFNLPDLTGDLELQVRLVTAASGTMTAAGEPGIFIFTSIEPAISDEECILVLNEL